MIFSPYYRMGYLLVAVLLNTAFLHFGFYQAEAADTDIVINEIMYHPGDTNTGDEYIELYNRSATPVNLGGWIFEEAVTFTFPLGTIIDPHAYLVVCQYEPNAINFYTITNTIGNYGGKLDNAGEQIILKNDDSPRMVIDVINYDDTAPWPTEPDGAGVSLELFAPDLDNNLVQSWGIGQLYTPGTANNPVESGVSDVIINEIMYHPQKKRYMHNRDTSFVAEGVYWWESGEDEKGEYIELYNRGAEPVNLLGWSLSGGVEFTFDQPAVLNPNQYRVVCADPVYITEKYQITNTVGPFIGALDNGGRRLILTNENGFVMDTVNYKDTPPWPIGPDQVGTSLECLDSYSNNDQARNWRGNRIPEPALPERDETPNYDWQFVSSTGAATSNILYFYIDGAGEWLLDEIRVSPAGQPEVQLLDNGSFDLNDTGWNKTGNHVGTYWTNQGAHDGTGCEHLVSTGVGGSSTNSLNIYSIPGMIVGQQYTISCWVKYLGGQTTMTYRLSGSGLLTQIEAISSIGANIGDEVAMIRGTPGAANSVSASGLPPLAEKLKHSIEKPTSFDAETITAEVVSDLPITSIMLDYQIYWPPYNVPMLTDSVMMYDDGLHGDGGGGDGIYGATIDPQDSQTFVRYRVTAANADGSWTWPDEAEPNPNKAYFVYNGEEDTNLPVYFLIVPQANLDALYADIWTKDYYDAALVADGIVYDHVGIHFRGRGWRYHSKKSWKISFNKTEYLREMNKLDLCMHHPIEQKVVSDLFWILGQENLATDIVRLHLNGRFHGMYMAQESPNDTWLKHRGYNENAEIFKASAGGPGIGGNLSYCGNHTLYPEAYDRRSDGLGSFDNLIGFTYDLTYTADNMIADLMRNHTELDDWMYRWAVQDITANADYAAQNYFVIYELLNPEKWQIFHFDTDMCFGCLMFLPPEQNCGAYNKTPLCCATNAHNRISGNSELRNRLLVIYKDVLENYLTEDQVFRLFDYYYQKCAIDREDEMLRWAGDFPTIMRDDNLANVKSWFTDRRNYLLGWLASQTIVGPPNAHPLITLGEPVKQPDSSYRITWNYSDAEQDRCLVDLYGWDRSWRCFNLIDVNIPAEAGSYTWTTNIPEIPEKDLYIHAVIRDNNSFLVGRDTTIRQPPVYVELVGDVNNDKIVDSVDLSLIAEMWLMPTETILPNPQSWDVSQQWSNTSNPNGPWTYKDNIGNIFPYQSGGTAGGGLAGWANSSDSVPSLFKGAWVPSGTGSSQVQGHGPWLIEWTSPIEGFVECSGYLWQFFEPTRRMKCTLSKNGVVFASVAVPQDLQGITLLGSANTVYFSQNEAGPISLVQQVKVGDTITLVGAGSGANSTSTFAAVGFTITETVGVPPELDLYRDNRIDLKDFAVLSENWLTEKE